MLPFLVPGTASAQDTTAEFRYLSTVLRDHLPSVAESKEFYAAADKDKALDDFLTEWLASADHEQRVARHFNDMFGVSPYFFVTDASLDLIAYDPADHPEAPSDLSVAGVYHLPASVKSSCGGAPVSANAWFSDTAIMICPSAVSTAISYGGGMIRCTDSFSANGILNPACGCGPEQIICYPRDLKHKTVVGIAREFADRGLRAYEQGWSWLDLFGGDLYYGDRWLYHHYLFQQKVAVTMQPPSASELAFLKSLPLDSKVEVAHPGGPERAGIVTSPAFLTRFNNFRSRVRALTDQLLCKDVDGSLNVDGYTSFLNTDLSAFDKSHGNKPGCATCHYGMDNFGSTLLGWTSDGYFEAWAPPSQIGHVFGEDGTGPRFLMQSYVERASGFVECMAKKSWEDFSGARWDDLTSSQKDELTAQAALGPKQAIRAVLTSSALKGRRASVTSVVKKTVVVIYDFNRDINPILEQSCGGQSCHAADNTRSAGSAYVGNESLFKGAPKERLANGSMPPAGATPGLTDDERNKLLIFLGQ